MKKRNILIIATTAAVIGSGLAYAGNKHRNGKHDISPEHRIEHMLMKMDKHLDLSDTQEAEIKSILDRRIEVFALAKEKRNSVRQTILQMNPKSPDFDAQAQSLADEMAEALHQRALEMAAAMKEVSAVLSDQQVEKARSVLAKRIETHNRHKAHKSECHSQG